VIHQRKAGQDWDRSSGRESRMDKLTVSVVVGDVVLLVGAGLARRPVVREVGVDGLLKN